MSDYTPTTDDVREDYISGRYDPYNEDNADWGTLREQFDRWLVAHDAELLERAAHRADLGYLYGQNCDDIARDIRAIRA